MGSKQGAGADHQPPQLSVVTGTFLLRIYWDWLDYSTLRGDKPPFCMYSTRLSLPIPWLCAGVPDIPNNFIKLLVMRFEQGDGMAHWSPPVNDNPHPTNPKSMLTMAIMFQSLATFIVILRVYTRCTITYGFGVDDVLVVLAQVNNFELLQRSRFRSQLPTSCDRPHHCSNITGSTIWWK